jgi:protein PhnA
MYFYFSIRHKLIKQHKGSSGLIKVTGLHLFGPRLLVDSSHNIDCKIDEIGPMSLKSEFVRKA